MQYLWVFIGGGLGSICRFGIAKLLANESLSFPIGTFVANVLSCIILGVFVSLNIKSAITEPWRLLLMTGFCGGFSTFSTFTNETYLLMTSGEYFQAGLNIFGSLITCLVCIWVGLKIGDKYL